MEYGRWPRSPTGRLPQPAGWGALHIYIIYIYIYIYNMYIYIYIYAREIIIIMIVIITSLIIITRSPSGKAGGGVVASGGACCGTRGARRVPSFVYLRNDSDECNGNDGCLLLHAAGSKRALSVFPSACSVDLRSPRVWAHLSRFDQETLHRASRPCASPDCPPLFRPPRIPVTWSLRLKSAELPPEENWV